MTYLIDSDESINFLNGRQRARDLIDGIRPDGLAMSVVSYAEIYEGVYASSDRRQAERRLSDLVAEMPILPVTLPIARRFAAIRGDLRRAGNLILDMDLLIAATAIEHGLTLVTGNRRHFDRVPGLKMHPGNGSANN